jgi:hypothetical protein
LAIAALLKFYPIAGRFPENLREVPEVALHYLHQSLELDAGVEPGSVYHLPSRTYERHRAEIRRFLSIRKADSSDQERAKQWLIHDVITGEQTDSELNAALMEWFRGQNLELISPKAQHPLIKSACHDFEKPFFQGIAEALSPSSQQAVDHLLRPLDEVVDGQATRFQMLSSDPAKPSLKTVFKEIEKLEAIERLALPGDLFSPIPIKMRHAYRLRAGTESITELRKPPETVRYVLVTAFCYERRAEIIDGLADLLIQLVHKIGVRAEKQVVRE